MSSMLMSTSTSAEKGAVVRQQQGTRDPPRLLENLKVREWGVLLPSNFHVVFLKGSGRGDFDAAA